MLNVTSIKGSNTWVMNFWLPTIWLDQNLHTFSYSTFSHAYKCPSGDHHNIYMSNEFNMFHRFLNRHERPNIRWNYFRKAYSKYFLSTVTVIHVMHLNIWQKHELFSRPCVQKTYSTIFKFLNFIKYNLISFLFLNRYAEHPSSWRHDLNNGKRKSL